MQEREHVWHASLCWCLTCDFLHGHQDFVDPGYVFLEFCDVVLKHSVLNSLSRSQPFHDSSVLVPDVLLDDALDCLDLLESVVDRAYLRNELSSFGHECLVDRPVDEVEPDPEGLFDGGDPVQGRVVRAHHGAVVADQLLARL